MIKHLKNQKHSTAVAFQVQDQNVKLRIYDISEFQVNEFVILDFDVFDFDF